LRCVQGEADCSLLQLQYLRMIRGGQAFVGWNAGQVTRMTEVDLAEVFADSKRPVAMGPQRQETRVRSLHL